MYSLSKRALVFLSSGILLGLTAYAASPGGLVGVAQGSGTIRINGQPFEGQASLWSGDQIVTAAASQLALISSPSERVRFEPSTSARVSKEAGRTLVALDRGAIDFQTGGAISTNLPGGIAVHPSGSAETLAQVARLVNGGAQIAVFKGSLQIVDTDETVTVSAGHTAVLSPAPNSAQNDQTDQEREKKKKKVWAVAISTGLSVGAALGIILNEPSRKESAVDP